MLGFGDIDGSLNRYIFYEMWNIYSVRKVSYKKKKGGGSQGEKIRISQFKFEFL